MVIDELGEEGLKLALEETTTPATLATGISLASFDTVLYTTRTGDGACDEPSMHKFIIPDYG